MKIGIIYDDIGREGLDCSDPTHGNPGVGGTQYCYLTLLYYYKNAFKDDEIIVYRYRALENLPAMPHREKILYRTCVDLVDAVNNASLDKVSLLLFNFNHVIELDTLLKKKKIKCLVWVHNWIRGEILKTLLENEYIKRVIFLGREHYDRYIDHDIISKSVVIPNMFPTDDYIIRNKKVGHVVTYVGAIVPGKGFLYLAKAWKSILKEVPDAELNVIGKGNLYGTNHQMGPLQIAEKEYEREFTKYIIDKNGNILQSVHFLGILGQEKADVYKRTSVGVINPTGRTEVCPISALEMEAAGIPVISKSINGIPDVILQENTGILIKRQGQLAKSVVKLLKDTDRNNRLGNNARDFVNKEFNPSSIILKWNTTFYDVINDIPCTILSPSENFTNNLKWIRIILFKLKTHKLFKSLPSFIDIEYKILRLIGRS